MNWRIINGIRLIVLRRRHSGICRSLYICCEALKTLGFIKRISSDFKLSYSLKSLYCSLVRSIVEFGSALWDPYTMSDLAKLETVQYEFLNYISFTLINLTTIFPCCNIYNLIILLTEEFQQI